MEESEGGKGWLMWVLIIPVALAAGALLTRWALHKPAPAAAPAAETAAAAPAQREPQAAAPAAGAPEELMSDEPDGGEAKVSWGEKPAAGAAPGGGRVSAGAPAQAAVDPKEAKKSFGMGLAYGALTKASEKLLNNPAALSALFNNDYVVKGFMSRDTVKQATASSASLANYLKNPANLSKFMAKAPVQRGMDNQDLVNAVASSKLAGAMLDTPGGQALLKDPAALADVLKSNPELGKVLANPVMLSALMNNPKTSGVVTQITMSGMGR